MCEETRKHGFEAEGGKVTFRSTVTVIRVDFLRVNYFLTIALYSIAQ